MNKKIIVLLTLLILLLSTISGCVQQDGIKEHTTLYVGKTNSEYRTIQEAIDAAVDGTLIFIDNGSYNELIVINKTISLIGKDKKTTIINFDPNFDIKRVPIITINADNCLIDNLSIILGRSSVLANGISITSTNNVIKNNIISNVQTGIELLADSAFNTITNNEIRNNQIGIDSIGSNNNIISHNNIVSNLQYNIFLSTDSDNNNVSFNILNHSDVGIRIKGSLYNKVFNNCVKNSQKGLYCCCGAQANYFYNNTLLNNSENAMEYSGLVNIWYDYPNGPGNYWDDYTGVDENQDGIGDIPIEIPEAGNRDNYPLLAPPLDVPCNQ